MRRVHTQLVAATPSYSSRAVLTAPALASAATTAAAGSGRWQRLEDEPEMNGAWHTSQGSGGAQGLATPVPCADRLAELKVGMPSAGADIEAGMPASSQSPAMTAFFEEVSAVKKSMQTIKYNIKLIEQSHGECLTAISSEQQRECTNRLEGLMKETNGAALTLTLTLTPVLTLTR